MAFDHAIALDPEDASNWNFKGHALSNLGKHAETTEAFDNAIALDPNMKVQ